MELVRRAKDEGLRVTAEMCPHHLVLTDHWVMGGDSPSIPSVNHYDTHTKVYPPLREAHDAEALLEGLVDGTIDCIATDHAPHEFAAKMCTYDDAEFGISVLETALGSLMGLVHRRAIDLPLLPRRHHPHRPKPRMGRRHRRVRIQGQEHPLPRRHVKG